MKTRYKNEFENGSFFMFYLKPEMEVTYSLNFNKLNEVRR